MIKIINNSIFTANSLGNPKPKVALLSAAENYNPKMESSKLATELTKYFSNSVQKTKAIIYGPLSLDLAISLDSVRKKRFSGPIQGDADILIAPQIDAGNILYKSLALFGNATMGGIVVGANIPLVVTSRNDSVESKLLSLKLALKQQKKGY